MKTRVFSCKVINSELQAAEYVSKKSSWGSSVNGFADEEAGLETASL